MPQDTKAVVCDECSRLISTADAACPFCGATRLGAGPGLKVRNFIKNRSVTSIFFWSNIVLYVVGLLLTGAPAFTIGDEFNILRFLAASGGVLHFLGGVNPVSVLGEHEYWRLITHAFLHLGILHIVFNMMALRNVGPFLESEFGGTRFSIIYLGSALAGGITIIAFKSAAVGASGAIFGMMGAGLGYAFRRGGTYGAELRGTFGRWAIEGLVISLLPGVSFAGHAGGFAGGFALAWILAPRARRSASSTAEPPYVSLLAGILLIAVPLSFILQISKSMLVGPTPFDGGSGGTRMIRREKLAISLAELGAPGWVMEFPSGIEKVREPNDGKIALYYPGRLALTVEVLATPDGGATALLKQKASEVNITTVESVEKDGDGFTLAIRDTGPSTTVATRIFARDIGEGRTILVAWSAQEREGPAMPAKETLQNVVGTLRRE